MFGVPVLHEVSVQAQESVFVIETLHSEVYAEAEESVRHWASNKVDCKCWISMLKKFIDYLATCLQHSNDSQL